MPLNFKIIIFVVFSFLAIERIVPLGGVAWAAKNYPEPASPKPPINVTSDVMSSSDARILRLALAAEESKNWPLLERYQIRAKDADLKALLFWFRLRGNDARISTPSMMEAVRTYKRLGWPSTGTIQDHVETRLIDAKNISAQTLIDWFAQIGGPNSGDGALALANAYRDIDETDKALAIIKPAWRTMKLSRNTSTRIIKNYRPYLNRADFEARVNLLIWQRAFTDAQRLRPYISRDWRALMDARIALGKLRRSGIDRLVQNVPDHLQDHPGLMFERGRWRRKRLGSKAGISIFRKIDGRDVIPQARERLWDERRLSLRTAIKEQAWQAAYDIAASNGMHTGTRFSASEWLAGWLALRHLAQAEKAIEHFNKMRVGVSSPISLARADYWLGRANDALGRPNAARAHYANAAKHNFTYYGQLAGEKLNNSVISFKAIPTITEEDRAAFESRQHIRVLRMLGEAGDLGMVRHFSFHLDDLLTAPAEYHQLAEIVREYAVPDAGVRAGKAGLYKHILAPNAAYPVPEYTFLREPNVERALIFGLARQESEMNRYARSSAGAVGLMQFLPSTARLEARRIGLPYKQTWLMDDPPYALTLGGAHLDYLIDRFDGSYAMAIAAYNAGASRVDRWIDTYGDPRTGEIHPVDWVEMIPFSETRNYVQRVLENTQVYRHRLTGTPQKSQTLRDLQRYTQ